LSDSVGCAAQAQQEWAALTYDKRAVVLRCHCGGGVQRLREGRRIRQEIRWVYSGEDQHEERACDRHGLDRS